MACRKRVDKVGRAVKVLIMKDSGEPLWGEFKQDSNRSAFAILKDAPGRPGGGHREIESSEEAGEEVSGQDPGFGNGGGRV